jgi:hypothetical protein
MDNAPQRRDRDIRRDRSTEGVRRLQGVVVRGNRIACDHGGCEYFVEFRVLRPDGVGRFTSEPLPRRLARKESWRIDHDGDFCPRHAEMWEFREL